MIIQTNTEVSFNVSKVLVHCVIIGQVENGDIKMITQFSWIDDNGTINRRDSSRYTQQQLESMCVAMGKTFSNFKTAFDSLLPAEGDCKNAIIDLLESGETTAIKGSNKTVNGNTQWVTEIVSQEQLETILVAAGESIANLRDVVDKATKAIFA